MSFSERGGGLKMKRASNNEEGDQPTTLPSHTQKSAGLCLCLFLNSNKVIIVNLSFQAIFVKNNFIDIRQASTLPLQG